MKIKKEKLIKPVSKQAGASLISSLIGMLISMLAILVSFGMHKNMVQVAIESKSSSNQDALISSTIMKLQYDVHDAGIGVEAASASDIVVTTVDTQRNLYWRYVDNNTFVCRGVRERDYVDTVTQLTGREVISIQADGDCTEDSDLTTQSWSEQSVYARFVNQDTPLFNFQLASEVCTPFGMGVTDQHFVVVVSALSSAEQAGAAVTRNEYRFCLANTHLG